MIPEVDANWAEDEHEKNRLSRALAAFALEQLADIPPTEAAAAIIDGGDDNGIDAIRFDRRSNVLWLVQAKIGSAPDLSENKKFCDGIRDIIASRFENFNHAFQSLLPEVEVALATDQLRIIGCQVHQGEHLGPHAIRDLEQLDRDLNEFTPRFEWSDIGVREVHGWLLQEEASEPVSTRLDLERWQGVEQPYRAFYGVVRASVLANLYHTFGKRLFESNIRYYLGAESVNTAIASTVHNRPDEMLYLNNGITAICTGIRPLPGADPRSGTFAVDNLSIVNGAQTVGSIYSVLETHGAVSDNARVLITIIEVGDNGNQLAEYITRSRNTQNAIRNLYFAALDPMQERLRRELALSGVMYRYRPSVEDRSNDRDIITLELGALALASFNGDTRFIVAAKKQSGHLYDTNGEYYRRLFRSDLNGIQLGRLVRVFQYAHDIFYNSERAEAPNSRRKLFYRHAKFFVLHIVARTHRGLIYSDSIEISEDDRVELSRVILDTAETVFTVSEELFSAAGKGYLSIFSNLTDCEPLARRVMENLPQRATNATSAVEAPSSHVRQD